jgi:hypothetical protein
MNPVVWNWLLLRAFAPLREPNLTDPRIPRPEISHAKTQKREEDVQCDSLD